MKNGHYQVRTVVDSFADIYYVNVLNGCSHLPHSFENVYVAVHIIETHRNYLLMIINVSYK